MRKITVLSFALCIGMILQAQQVTDNKTFKVEGYSIANVGYPSKLVPLGNEKFAYLEYWVASPSEGRKYPGYYLQGYNARFDEDWYTPITGPNEPKFTVTELFRLKSSLAVIGKQFMASTKRDETFVKFYNLGGKEMGGAVKMSSLDKSAKGKWQDEYALSADTSKILWMGENPALTGKKRMYYFSVFESGGKQLWAKKLTVPKVEGKYKVSQSAVDGKGNLYLLMVYETVTNTAKDTLFKPFILRYDFRESKWAEHKVDFPNASVPEGRIHITQDDDLVFVGILSDGSANGFLNGAKAFPTALKWNRIVVKKFNITRELNLVNESLLDIPESWIKRYGTNGANFTQSQVLESGNNLLWVLEEHYTQIHNKELQYLYYDVAAVALDKESGNIRWANYFEKRQRDYSSGRLLSFTPGLAAGKLNIVYLTEKGASGKVVCSAFDLGTGAVTYKELLSNNNADNFFFPRRSSMVGSNTMMLMGVGNYAGNEYKLIRVKF